MARTPTGTLSRTALRFLQTAVLAALAMSAASCDGNYAAEEPVGQRPGPSRKFDPDAPTVFGDEGLAVGTIRSVGDIFGGGGEEAQGRLPVNKYLWHGALDTLSFLPLASSDPFTGVIATDWSATPEAPSERFKATAFITSSTLSAASLKVAIYRERRNEEGIWVPAPVDPDTARKLEDAILTRAREIRIAEREGRAAG